jgi:CheY-like chemotaxis protein
VDDIASNLRVAKELVSLYGATVETCGSGEAAVELVEKNHYDLVFMDHMMPGMDGLEATLRIRGLGESDDYYATLPIIALTANAISGRREMFLEKGMDDFLAKPIDMQRLERILKKWIPDEKRILVTEDAVALSAGDFNLSSEKALVIPSIDTMWGIKNTGGSIETYCDILKNFCSEVDEKARQIKKTEENENIKLYGIYTHAMKGAARSVGAFELGNSAAQMEEAAVQGDTETIHAKTDEFLRDVQVLLGHIRAALGDDAADPRNTAIDNEPPSAADLQLEVLKAALINMDIETVNDLLRKHVSMKLGTRTKNIVSEIEQHVLMFEYDKAVEKIDLLL